MKKILKKLKKLNNSGSSIVMVIAALAFLAIIVGSLLTAAGYAYRMKFQDLNARDNFYYVEQAMNEVYAGIGADTMDAIKEAYIYTVENMTYYDVSKNMYVTKSDEACQEEFEETFMDLFYGVSSPYLNSSTAEDRIASFITNDSVVFNANDTEISADQKFAVKPIYKEGSTTVVDRVEIRNIRLTRTQDYTKSVANGSFTQTLSTDIIVGKPDFKVLFNSVNTDYSKLFDYALVADMGIEVNQPSTPLTINGNVYAANDFYNKLYNRSMYSEEAALAEVFGSGEVAEKYHHVPVTSKVNAGSTNDYRNKTETYLSKTLDESKFDGQNIRSMYSGIYVDHSDVSIIAKRVVVPGTIAVMDRGTISIYGREGKASKNAEVWTDNIVLGGFSKKTYAPGDTLNEHPLYKGSKAVIKADLYVRDDTELNAAGSELVVNGSYYGYGDSTTRDTRKYTSIVNSENFIVDEVDEYGRTVYDSAGNKVTTNRGHYNSSAIIVNGEQSKINFAMIDNLYIAGKAYVEMSKDVKNEQNATINFVDKDGNEKAIVDEEGKSVTSESGITKTYRYNPYENPEAPIEDRKKIRDYSLGESLSIKSNYKAYVPIMYSGMPEKAKDDDPDFGEYYEAELHMALQGSDLFEKYFPEQIFHNKIPCIMQTVSGKKYFYYNFAKIYNDINKARTTVGVPTMTSVLIAPGTSPETFASSFITDYVAELNDEFSPIRQYMVDITDYEDFEAGDIILPDANNNAHVYSSGAITSKQGVSFDVTTSRNNQGTSISRIFDNEKYVANGSVSVASVGSDLNKEFEYVKWNLDHFVDRDDTNFVITNDIQAEMNYLNDLVSSGEYGSAAVTPINKYMNFAKITADVNYAPSGSSSTATPTADITSDMLIWISDRDVLVRDNDNDRSVTGIVVTKGDVEFDSNVSHFSGIIISGGKIYVNNSVMTIQSSPQTCITLLRNCQLSNSDEAKFILDLFKVDSDLSEDVGNSEETARTIDTIDYSDVVKMSNWIKKAE